MAYQIKQGDTRPVYQAQLLDGFGTPAEAPLDLTNATQVKIKLRTTGDEGAPKVNGTMVITTPKTAGIVTYQWAAGDLDTPGKYDVEFEITWTGGGIETVPNDGYLELEVVDDLDA